MTDRDIRPFRRAWLPVLAWTAVIWMLGGDSFSATQTSRVLDPLLDWLLPGISPDARLDLVWLIRLSAHPIVYGIEAVLVGRALRLHFPALSAAKLAGLAFAASAVLAGADEIRQWGSSVRDGSPVGVGLDLLGASVAIAGMNRLERRRGRRFFRPHPGTDPPTPPSPTLTPFC